MQEGSKRDDWRSSPSLNVIGVIISIIGLVISSFSDISTLFKIVVMVAGFATCLYVVLSGKARSNTSASTTPKPVDTPPFSPTPPAHRESGQASPAISHPSTLPDQPTPVPAAIAGTGGQELSVKERLITLLSAAIMFGLPGFLLFRSSIAWLHIVGILLLVFLVLGALYIVFPKLGDDMDKFSNKLAETADKLAEH